MSVIKDQEPLKYTKGYGKNAQMVTVEDRNGVPIHKGDFIQCMVNTHNWLKEGEIVIAVGARDGAFGPSISYETMDRSSSGIAASMVERVDTTPELRKEMEKVYLYHRLSQVNERISKLHMERAGLQAQLDNLT